MQLCRFTVGDDPTPRVGLMDASAICELGADGSVVCERKTKERGGIYS